VVDAWGGAQKDKSLPMHLQGRLRDFFRFKRFNADGGTHQYLLTTMSPKLRGEVCVFTPPSHVVLCLHPPLARCVVCFASSRAGQGNEGSAVFPGEMLSSARVDSRAPTAAQSCEHLTWFASGREWGCEVCVSSAWAGN
jgi:hypothetical protein